MSIIWKESFGTKTLVSNDSWFGSVVVRKELDLLRYCILKTDNVWCHWFSPSIGGKGFQPIHDWMIYKSLLVSTPCFWCQESKKKYEVILWNVCTVHNFEQMAFPFLRNYVIPKFDMVGIILIIWYYHFIFSLSMTFNWMNIIVYSRLFKLFW